MTYLRKQIIEAWQFFIVPGIAALLPWRLAWRWLRWRAQHDGGPFDEAARAALAVAPKHLAVGDEKSFVAKVRLLWLMDYCDLYLSITRWRRAWRPWHVQRIGEWPRGAFIAAGFHHGTCHWVFKTLAEAGHDSMVISIRWSRDEYAGLPMRYWYGRLRYWDMARLGRRPIAYRPGIKQMLGQTLADGAAVVGLIDLPPRMAPRGQRSVRMLDLDVSLPDGVVALARDAGVPIVPYWMEFDADMYQRRFCIGNPIDPSDTDAALQSLADILDRQIRVAPQAWFFWPELPQWIADAQAHKGAADGTGVDAAD
jgi:hypothetical protein